MPNHIVHIVRSKCVMAYTPDPEIHQWPQNQVTKFTNSKENIQVLYLYISNLKRYRIELYEIIVFGIHLKYDIYNYQ